MTSTEELATSAIILDRLAEYESIDDINNYIAENFPPFIAYGFLIRKGDYLEMKSICVKKSDITKDDIDRIVKNLIKIISETEADSDFIGFKANILAKYENTYLVG